MIIKTDSGLSFDTELDFTPAERHVLQKLFLWETMAGSLGQFRNKRDEAMAKGWNNTGPVAMNDKLSAVLADMERRLLKRLADNKGTGS